MIYRKKVLSKHALKMRKKLEKIIIQHSEKTNPDKTYTYKIEDVIGQWIILYYFYKKQGDDNCDTCHCGQPNLVKKYAIQNTQNGKILYPIGCICIDYFDGSDLPQEAREFRKYYHKFNRYGDHVLESGKYEGHLIKDVFKIDPDYCRFVSLNRKTSKTNFNFGNYGLLSLYYHLKTNNVIYKSDEEEFEIRNE